MLLKIFIKYDSFFAQSNVAYHGDLKKKAEMEQRRTLNSENGHAENASSKFPNTSKSDGNESIS